MIRSVRVWGGLAVLAALVLGLVGMLLIPGLAPAGDARYLGGPR